MVDIGSDATDRAASVSSSTRINLNNPAATSGSIDEVQVYAATNMSGIEFASFHDNGDSTYSTNGDTDGSNLSATAAQVTTFNAPGDFTAFAIASAEYIGVYYSGGTLERDSAGGSGYDYFGTDRIPCTSAGSWNSAAGILSLGANLAAAGGITGAAAGALAFVGGITRKYYGKRPASGSSTPAGSVSRKSVLHRAASGAWSAAGAVTYFAAAFYQEAIAGVLSLSGALSRKLMANRSTGGSIAPSASLSRKMTAKRTAQGAITPAGSLSRFARYARAVAGTAAFAGIVAYVSGQLIAGVLAFAGALAARAIFKRTVGGSLSMSGDSGRQSFYARIVAGVLTFGGIIPVVSSTIRRGLLRLGKAFNFR